jgi:hypothetical protein
LGVPGVAAVEAGYADVECYGQLHKYNVWEYGNYEEYQNQK